MALNDEQTRAYETTLKIIENAAKSESTELSIGSGDSGYLAELPAETWQLIHLQRLHISGGWEESISNLSYLPEAIGQLGNLTDLHFSYTSLKSLPNAIGKLNNLVSLTVSYNDELSSLPVTIGQLTNLKILDISWNSLTSIPAEIGELNNLTSLDLSHNPITFLPREIGRLTNLTSLNLFENRLTDLPAEIGQLINIPRLDLQGNSLTTLPAEIGRLKNLTYLSLFNNGLSELPPEIGQLTNLAHLEISGNQIKNLPAEIGLLAKLEYLSCSHQLNSLSSEIGNLTNLTELHIPFNNLTSLPPEIGKLKKLERLTIRNNQLRSLPLEIRNITNLKELDLRENPLPIPPEILEKVNEPQKILSYYFSLSLQKSSETNAITLDEDHAKALAEELVSKSRITSTDKPLNELKLLCIGQGSVGKTSIVQRIIANAFDQNQLKTEGISIDQWQIKNGRNNGSNSNIKINIWDFGGQEIMHATHQFFLTKRSLYLLVLDSRLTQEENRVEYWLKIIQSFGGESPVLIVGNKIDQHPLDIDRTGLQKKYPNIVGIFNTSAATGAGIEELKAAITEQVNNLPHVRDLLPETWFTVKTKLEGLGRESNFITHDKYLELCAQNEVSDETSQRALIGFLHDLGVVLHFQDDPRLEALGILNPQWVTNGVYKILNSHTLFQNKGVLTVSMLDEILNLSEYPRGKRLFIVDMMKKFELCYDIEADKTFLVPDLLPKDEPTDLKFNGVPAFEYTYPVLPSSVITRFIVRMNQKIDDGLVWRTGVVLKIGDNTALVKADIEDRKITIAIDGLEHTRRDALSAIRYQLDEIHNSIKGLNPEKYVPVPGVANAKPLKYEYLLKLERAGKDTLDVEDGDGLKEVHIAQMLNGVESEYQRKQYGNVTNINIDGSANGSTIIVGNDNKVK